MVYDAIKRLAEYGVQTGLISELDRTYAVNQLLEVLGLDEYEEPEGAVSVETGDLEGILKELLDYACAQGLLEDSVVYRICLTRS